MKYDSINLAVEKEGTAAMNSAIKFVLVDYVKIVTPVSHVTHSQFLSMRARKKIF